MQWFGYWIAWITIVATKTALKLSDYVVTEAGFGADLGAEKFFNIKCPKAALKPAAAVLLATVRALKFHGGADKDQLEQPNLELLKKGMANLKRHLANLKSFGVPVAVAINRFDSDTIEEIQMIEQAAREMGTEAILCTHWTDGGAGTEKLAKHVAQLVDSGTAQFAPLYQAELPLWDKVELLATKLYGAHEIIADTKIRAEFENLQKDGYGHYPVCIAKTPYSFSTDQRLKGAPSNHVVSIREIRLATGAEFLVVICGEIMTMPGLPKIPAAHQIHIDQDGLIEGLF